MHDPFEQISRTYLTVGGFQHTTQAGVVVTVGRRSIKHVTQRLFSPVCWV